jgi:dienelactone hydrolase
VSTHFGAVVTASSKLPVDLYLPSGLKKAPVAVVAHGFSRSRKNMAGLGRLLGSHGFITAVPDLPSPGDYRRNALALAALLDQLHSDHLLQVPRPNGKSALVGYSLGGLAALLASAMVPHARCWIGLDPVDINGAGEQAAKTLRIPSVVLCAEPGPWTYGTGQIIRALSSPRLALRVKHATHCDPESQTDLMTQFFCGRQNPARRQVFEKYTIAALRALFFDHPTARNSLRAAQKDPRVSNVTMHKIEAFRLSKIRNEHTP